MRLTGDWLLLAILACIGLSLGLFWAGLLPYPFGIFILLVFLAARLAYRKSKVEADRPDNR